jgi:D-glycero-D-manno-heptose 1,7-bisphosphate phosphatase
MPLKRAVFVDRDGVLNKAVEREGKPYPPASLAQLELAEDVLDACTVLRQAGFFLGCVTNQPDIARGKTRAEDVEAINDHVRVTLGLDALVMCPHDNADNCQCRKPKPGMILTLAGLYDIDLSKSIMVGDRLGDIEAGRAAGCRTVFIDHHWDEKRPERMDVVFSSLSAAVPWILSSL